jgi:hypothetical protein
VPAGKSTTISTSPRAVEALRHLEDSIGGRDALIDTLVLAKLDDRQQHFLRMLVDPARSADTLAKICKDAGMKPNALIEMYRTASFAKANAIGIGLAADAIPTVVRDLAAKSVDRQIDCPKCRGQKVNAKGDPCYDCAGHGTILVESDLSRQHTLLDMLGLGRKSSGGVLINNTNAQSMNVGVGSLFSTFVRATDKAAYDVSAPIIDATEEPSGA